MANYEIKDNVTGKTVVVSGDSPPTEQEAMQIFSDAGLRKQEQTPSIPGFMGRMNEDLVKRGVNISNELIPKSIESLDQTLFNAPGRALRVTGQVAGLANDVVG